MRQRTNILQNIDWITVSLYFLLVIIGWINIYAAEYTSEHSSIFDMGMNYGKQMMWILTSVILIFLIFIIDAKFFSTFSWFIFLGIMGMLVGVLLFGKEIAGSKSWFQIGSFSLQPSEFAKFATALALAGYISKINTDFSKVSTKMKAAVIIFIPSVLILLQHDTGSALVFFALVLVLFREGMSGSLLFLAIVAAILFISALLINKFIILGILALIAILIFYFMKRLRKKWLWIVGIFLITSGYIFSVDYVFENILEPHQTKRINVLLGIEKDIRGAGYNVHQSKIAIGSGGFSGKGFLKGTQTKFDFVPEQSTDFIFCTVGEEWGFIGTFVVIALFLGLLYRLIFLAERQRSKFSRVYGYGVASILFFHFAINIGMTIGLFPVIGIPLPFLSYGGSSLWGFTILLFVFLKQDAVRLELL
ncbi:MAG: rod shape-determining protein RodA [Bacteroidales bacterium]|nr:rod shape-determining protein RodA [Bacteroidales bacterium]MCF8404041.1 rod shape-determining protein RodA [Bacteroidales bacterium]